MEKRKNEISVFQKIGVDEITYLTLREQKELQKKSMMRIVKDLVFEKFNKKYK